MEIVDGFKTIPFLIVHNTLWPFLHAPCILGFLFHFQHIRMTQTASIFLRQQIFVTSCHPYKSTYKPLQVPRGTMFLPLPKCSTNGLAQIEEAMFPGAMTSLNSFQTVRPFKGSESTVLWERVWSMRTSWTVRFVLIIEVINNSLIAQVEAVSSYLNQIHES